ncbi:MAG: recombinase family protein [Bdellovibrionales bacterium]|nr:recombinase family protein [Bdellovibrionales bacterium]
MSKTLKRLWTVRIEGLYKSDRDERLTKAFEIILPEIQRTTQKSEVKTHEQNHSDLRQGSQATSKPKKELLNHKFQVFENIVSVKDTRLKKILFLLTMASVAQLLCAQGLDALRDKAVAGEVNQILILCPDRLARKYAHQLILVEEFKKLGVEINFANRTISTSPEDQLLFQIQGVISEFEREKIIERSRRGKLYKAKAGKVSVLSGAPYGYVYISATESEECRYEIHPEEATVVKRIFHRYIYDRKALGQLLENSRQKAFPVDTMWVTGSVQ